MGRFVWDDLICMGRFVWDEYLYGVVVCIDYLYGIICMGKLVWEDDVYG